MEVQRVLDNFDKLFSSGIGGQVHIIFNYIKMLLHKYLFGMEWSQSYYM